MSEVVIYTTMMCPYCFRAKSLFEKKGVEFREISAPRGSTEREEAIERSGGVTTVPQIFIDGRHIGGCDDVMALDRAGSLDPLLG